MKHLAIPLVLAAVFPARAMTTITLGESSGAAGTSGTVPVHVQTSGGVAALQLDIAHAPSGVSLGAPIKGDAAAGHLLDSGVVQGKLRAVLFSADNSPLAAGRLLDVPVNFTTTIAEDQRGLSLTNVILTDASGGTVEAFLLPFGRIVSPDSGTVHPDSFINGLKVGAIALDTDKAVSSVEFKVNGQSIGLTTTAPYALSWHPTAEGDFVITALVTDNDGNQVELAPRPLSVGLLSSYDEWASTHFGDDSTNPEIAGRLADPNANGLPNLFEFALGRNPRTQGSEGLPQTKVMAVGGLNFLSLSYRVPASVEGVSYRVEYSDDLETWQSGEGHTVEEESQVDSLMKTVTVRAAQPVNPSRGQGFLRLSVEMK